MRAVNALIFDEVMRNVSEVADVFAADGAARLERQSLDRADFDRLADAGLIRTGLPGNRGGLWQGSRANVRDYVALYRRLAGADPSVALVSTMHPLVLAFWLQPDCDGTFASSAWRAQCDRYFSLVESGCWFGTIASEPGSAGDLMATRASARLSSSGCYLMSGLKHMGSGSGVTSFMLTVARPDGEEIPDVFVMDTREQKWDGSTGTQLLGEWDGIGMAATQSHAFRFEEVAVERYAEPGCAIAQAPFVLPFGQTIFAAVTVGILDMAMRLVDERLGPKSAELRPLEQIEWTKAANGYWTVKAALEQMIVSIEQDDDALLNSCRGKWVIAETAEAVMASLAKAVGGRAFSRSLPLAQWGQDVRALGFLRPPWALAQDQLFELGLPPAV